MFESLLRFKANKTSACNSDITCPTGVVDCQYRRHDFESFARPVDNMTTYRGDITISRDIHALR